MFRRIAVGDIERVVLVRDGRFINVFGPGVHWVPAFGSKIEIKTYDVRTLVFAGDWAAFVAAERPDILANWFTLVETSDAEVAVVYLDGKLNRVVGPGQRVLLWRGPFTVTAEIIAVVADPQVPERISSALAKLGTAGLAISTVIDACKRGLLTIDGKVVRELGPGAYSFWSAVSMPRVEIIETRLQTLEVPGQEILTRDKVTLRVNVSAMFEVVDPGLARATVKDATEHLYRMLQIAVRRTLGKRTLDEVLAEKLDLDEAVLTDVRTAMEAHGVRVGEIALKDIILPGDIREILNQVVTAEKQAQANLIRRREETAATRSLLNTAKLMEDNPLLVRMKELETLEKIADKVERLTVVGGLDALLDRTLSIRGNPGRE